MRMWLIVAASLSCACIVGEDPDFAGESASTDGGDGATGTGTSGATGDTSGTETGTTGTDTGTTDTGTTDTGTIETGSTDTGAEPMHRIFVTSVVYPGDLGGLSGADEKCQAQADAADLSGTWKAVLSAGGTNARDRIVIDGPVLNMLDESIAANGPDLWDMMLDHPVLYDETLAARPGDVWTGSAVDGTASGVDCSGWTATSASGHRGGAEDANNDWLNRGFRFCDWTLALYCVSQ